LYLAEQIIEGRVHYVIRESFKEGPVFKSRDLFDLGSHPGRYITYPGGNSYYIADEVCDALYDLGVDPDTDDLEDIFGPFMDPRVRRLVDSARQRARGRRKERPLTADRQRQIERQVGAFDKRRALYLRSGEVDQGRMRNIPVQIYKWIYGKSRDEIEQTFMQMEGRLEAAERKVYMFVIFDLQRFFTESWAKKMPQGLNPDKMDRYFLEEICHLNNDTSFWGDGQNHSFLNDYLKRYAVMFFDYDFGPDTFWQDYIKQFMDARRKHRPPPVRRSLSDEEVSAVFGVKEDALKTMTRRGLDRLYRRMAKKMHPDKGGTHEAFIRLSEAYDELRARRAGPGRWRRR